MATDNRTRMSQHEPPRATKTAEIIIVGGGVIGLSIARELARHGVSDILLFDKSELGKEASWAAGGILAPQVEADSTDDFFKLANASRNLYPSFAQALHDETGIDVELDPTGTLYVAFSEDDEAALRQRFAWQQRAGLRIEWLDSKDVRRVEANLSREVRCALRFPNDWQVENRKLIEALIASNENLGVQLVPNCEVSSLHERNRVVGVRTRRGTIAAPVVVNCAGAWTSSLFPVEVEPVRGQMLCFKPSTQLAQHVIYSSRGYLVPRRDGRLLAGSTSEHVGFDKRVTAEGINAIQSMAFDIAPSLRAERLTDSWAGFRPRASDDLPVIGPDAEIAGLFHATGHYRNGILLTPITANLVAKLITDGSHSPLFAGFSPNRLDAVAANP
jgi:glycine oxidase